ncbi:MAG: two-component system sensor histidine kinase NtrB [Gemmatimonadaceae bacterium]
MRTLTPAATLAIRAALEPQRVLRWVYIGRICLATAIFAAAVLVWQSTPASQTLIASLAFAATAVFTVGSIAYTEFYRRTFGRTFVYLQTIFDLLLVTTVVHLTGGSASQFAALYILVIASASLLLPMGGGLLIAALGNVLYFADAIWGSGFDPTGIVWLQLAVFGAVALAAGYLGARLQEAGIGKLALAEELAKARLEAADILRNIRSGIITIDTGGRLLYANPAASSLLGLDLDASIGRPVLAAISLVSGTLATALQRCVHDRVRTNRAEGTIRIADHMHDIGVTTTCSEESADPARTTATAIFQDISETKRLRALHLRAERLEAVAEFSASLAHEIRNPLASIRSSVEQLARIPAATEDEQTLAALIVRESDRLSRLLSEFLDFARVRVTRVAPVDLGVLAQGAAALALAHPDLKPGVRLTCRTPPEPVLIDGDEDLLHRAVLNLSLNAVQATPEGGRIDIELSRVPAEDIPGEAGFDGGENGGREPGEVISLTVTDSGPGIPPEIRDRLFDPFFTTKQGGSGLGLPVVHRAIEAHHGLVFIDSDAVEGDAGGARGTRFTIILPRGQQPIRSQQ